MRIVLVITLIFASLLYAEHESIDPLESGFFNREQADRYISQIAEALGCFRDLTDLIVRRSAKGDPLRWPADAKIAVTFEREDFVQVGNMHADLQTIGFSNMPHYVRGYVDYVEYQNLLLTLEVAKLKNASSSEITAMTKQVERRKEFIKKNYSSWVD